MSTSSNPSIWFKLQDIIYVLKKCRFSVINLLVGVIFFGFAAQGIDTLRYMLEQKSLVLDFVFFTSVSFWALSIWYWARQILKLEHINDIVHDSKQLKRIKTINKNLARILGLIAFLIIAYGFYQASKDYESLAYLQIGISLGLAVVFYIFVVKRHAWFNLHGNKSSVSDYHASHDSIASLPPITKILLFTSFAISILMMLLFVFFPLSAQWITTPVLLLIAAANWVAIGTTITVISDIKRIPIISIALILAIPFSLWNDNHQVKLLDNAAAQRNTIAQHFPNWLASRTPLEKDSNKIPVIIVVAEGGGIRAAYWSSGVLSAIQDRVPAFANYIYSMSGVSGGSLGIVTFITLYKNHVSFEADKLITGNTDRCFERDIRSQFQTCSNAILSYDFLAPPVGRLLYADLLQNFLPFPVSYFDRAAAIEDAWSVAVYEQTGYNDFNQAFQNIWANDTKFELPSLLLNSTWVESGKRVIVSNLDVHKDFNDAIDFHHQFKKQLPMKTAIHNSARFTYVSPAGSIYDPTKADTPLWGHVVDGGYFENSGATGALEVLQTIKLNLTEEDWANIVPVVIMLTNDPFIDDCAQTKPTPLLRQILSPVRAMINTRTARGSYSREALFEFTKYNHGHFYELGLQEVKGPVPLGWLLSENAKGLMDYEVMKIFDGKKIDNLEQLFEVLEHHQRQECF